MDLHLITLQYLMSRLGATLRRLSLCNMFVSESTALGERELVHMDRVLQVYIESSIASDSSPMYIFIYLFIMCIGIFVYFV